MDASNLVGFSILVRTLPLFIFSTLTDEMRQKSSKGNDALFVDKRGYYVARRYDNKILWHCRSKSSTNCKGRGLSTGNHFVMTGPHTCALLDKSPFER